MDSSPDRALHAACTETQLAGPGTCRSSRSQQEETSSQQMQRSSSACPAQDQTLMQMWKWRHRRPAGQLVQGTPKTLPAPRLQRCFLPRRPWKPSPSPSQSSCVLQPSVRTTPFAPSSSGHALAAHRRFLPVRAEEVLTWSRCGRRITMSRACAVEEARRARARPQRARRVRSSCACSLEFYSWPPRTITPLVAPTIKPFHRAVSRHRPVRVRFRG